MKKSLFLTFLLASVGLAACGQKSKSKQKTEPPASNNTLLWRISGKDLTKPSYLFGTMHLLCGDDIVVSDSLRSAIQQSDNDYLEHELDNIFEMFGAMQSMNMNGDTTLSDLLTEKEYQQVKDYFDENPLSQLAIIVSKNSISQKVTELSGKKHDTMIYC